MPFAVTHVLLTIICVAIYRDFIAKKKFPMYIVLLAGFAGLLPDIDIAIGWIMTPFGIMIQHGTLTHTPLLALLFAVPGLVFLRLGKHNKSIIYFVISFGVIFHIFLDWLLGGGGHYGLMLLYPISTVTYRINLLGNFDLAQVPAALDAFILLAWLTYEEFKHKIKDFI